MPLKYCTSMMLFKNQPQLLHFHHLKIPFKNIPIYIVDNTQIVSLKFTKNNKT